MRTTVDISPDLLARVRKLADKEGVSFKEALGRVIARGNTGTATATTGLVARGTTVHVDSDSAKCGRLISFMTPARPMMMIATHPRAIAMADARTDSAISCQDDLLTIPSFLHAPHVGADSSGHGTSTP